MISQIKQKGFTIVELLIVIVVIAILAAISIAAYSNITARANTSTSTAAAKSVRDVAQAFNSENATGLWPTTKAQFTQESSVARLDPTVTFATSMTSAPSSPNTVLVQRVGASAAGPATGIRVTHWDFAKGEPVVTNVGTGSTVLTTGGTIPNS